MAGWLGVRLRRALQRLQAEDVSTRGAELRYLRTRLAALEEDRASLRGMLGTSKDSFHHGLASGTTGHAESLDEARERLLERIRRLEDRLSEPAAAERSAGRVTTRRMP